MNPTDYSIDGTVTEVGVVDELTTRQITDLVTTILVADAVKAAKQSTPPLSDDVQQGLRICLDHIEALEGVISDRDEEAEAAATRIDELTSLLRAYDWPSDEIE